MGKSLKWIVTGGLIIFSLGILHEFDYKDLDNKIKEVNEHKVLDNSFSYDCPQKQDINSNTYNIENYIPVDSLKLKN